MITLELAQALVKFDDDHDCRLCSKWQWGEEHHDKNCPMTMAYQIIHEADSTNKPEETIS